MKNLHCLLSLIFLFSCFISLVLSFSTPQTHHLPKQCLDDQKFYLLQLQQQLYYAQNFTFSSKFDLWDLNTDCCSWKGVTCDSLGHVTGIDLSYKNLSGTFHSVFNLHRLQRFNLAGNNFNTTLLSYEFDKLPNLTHLNLFGSCFHGQIPMEISYLTRLVSLDLSYQDYCYWRNNDYYDSSLTLTLEKPNFKTLIKNMRFLRELYLDRVNISSESNTWCETISSVLSNLQVLSLSNCGLQGPLRSSLSTLPFLSELTLDGNSISYLPPNFLEISSHLVSLSLVDCNLSGHFPLSISNLSHLVYLDLSDNHFSGSIPSSLFTLPSLRELSLGWNQLVGEIAEFSNVSSSLIKGLDLGRNYFFGPLPKSIFQLPRLEWLYIGDNNFGSMKLHILFKLKNLRALDLSNISLFIESHNTSLNDDFSKLEILILRSCNLTEFPEFIKTQDLLFDLDLSNNHIHGVVPNWLWKISLSWVDLSFNPIEHLPLVDSNLSSPKLSRLILRSCNISVFPEVLRSTENLEELDLSNNRISGEISKWVGKKSLIRLDLSYNHLSSLDHPSPICNLSQLLTLDASRNNLSGSIPNCLENMGQLTYFDVSHNNLSGQIPNCLRNMSALSYLNLQGNKLSGIMPGFSKENQLMILKVSENRLEGKLPRSLKECTYLRVLDVGKNMMHDTFPFWLEKLPDLLVLTLRGNRFYGQMKHLKHKISFPALDVLDIASNQFYGELSIDFLNATQLRTLKIGGNKFEGKLPTSLANCKKLEVLDLGNNMIHDTFPFWLEKLHFLKVLILRGNRFYGTITKFDSEGGFPVLRILDIASNNFSGDLSIEFIKSLKEMMQITNDDKAKLEYIGERNINGKYYQDSVTIVNKGVELLYEKVLTVLTCLDISNNSFYGRIPEEIHILRSLHVLNLSGNSFSGGIPLTLENLKDLESLDLSVNKLSGKIPPQLSSLTFLEAFNLSYNQLEGSIPQSNQFNTFSNDSYIGNPKLCGPPLSRKCNEVDLPMPPPPGEHEDSSWLDVLSIWQIALVGYASGLVAGICLGYTMLNELGNKWVDKFNKHGKRNRRRSR